jgi:hypothetical protein
MPDVRRRTVLKAVLHDNVREWLSLVAREQHLGPELGTRDPANIFT